MPAFQFEVEYAKSGRAACKLCKEKIQKDAVRLGFKVVAVEGAEQVDHAQEAVKWHHARCFPRARGPAWFKKHFPGDMENDLTGAAALTPEDSALVSEILRACRGECRLSEAPPATTPALETVPAPSGEELETPTKGEAGVGKKRRGRPPADGNEESRAAKAAKPAPPAASVTVLSEAEVAAIAAARAQLATKNAAVLGALLAKNGLPKSGKKDDLLDRAAECQALGVPPTCPLCEKVKLRWSRETGKFSCPGFFDDEAKHFRRCKGSGEGLQRTPWREIGADL